MASILTFETSQVPLRWSASWRIEGAVLGCEDPLFDCEATSSNTYIVVTPRAYQEGSDMGSGRCNTNDKDDFWCKKRRLWAVATFGRTEGGGLNRRFLDWGDVELGDFLVDELDWLGVPWPFGRFSRIDGPPEEEEPWAFDDTGMFQKILASFSQRSNLSNSGDPSCCGNPSYGGSRRRQRFNVLKTSRSFLHHVLHFVYLSDNCVFRWALLFWATSGGFYLPVHSILLVSKMANIARSKCLKMVSPVINAFSFPHRSNLILRSVAVTCVSESYWCLFAEFEFERGTKRYSE